MALHLSVTFTNNLIIKSLFVDIMILMFEEKLIIVLNKKSKKWLNSYQKKLLKLS